MSFKNFIISLFLFSLANGFTDVIRRVLELGVNPNYASYGDNAISIAKENKNSEMIKFLNDNGIK